MWFMWNGEMFNEFMNVDNPDILAVKDKPGSCIRHAGSIYYVLADEPAVAETMARAHEMSAKELLRFILDNSQKLPAKKRASYVRQMVFCFHNLLIR